MRTNTQVTNGIIGIWILWAGMAASSGCGKTSDPVEEEKDSDTEVDAGLLPATAALHCPGDLDETAAGYVCIVEGKLTADTVPSPEALVWVAGMRYILSGIVSVEEATTLTLEPGTVVLGDPESPGISPSSLFIARGATINAVGTAERPIVFSSAKALGERAPGDWGGVVIRGAAPVNNCQNKVCDNDIQELYPAGYGGADLTDSSGTLAYVRIEFSGRAEAFDIPRPIDGLSLLGVGGKTDIHHIQIHKTAASGVAIDGGVVSLHHLLVTGAAQRGFAWYHGWIGRAQFVIAHHLPGEGLGGVEGFNVKETGQEDTSPRSSPTLYNFTVSGSGAVASSALHFYAGTAGTLANFLLPVGTGFSTGIDIQDDTTWTQATNGALSIAGSIFPSMAGCFADDDTSGYLESDWWTGGTGNRIADIALPGAAASDGPRFMPEAGSPALNGAVAPPAGVSFFEKVSFVGAVGQDDWTAGWTAFPEN